MTTRALLHQLRTLGVTLGVTLTPYPDGTLHYLAPKDTVTPAVLELIRQHKSELHALVEAFEERAAIAEYCGGLERPAAENLAWQCVLGERQADRGGRTHA